MAKQLSESSSSQVIDYLKDLDKRVTGLEEAMRPFIKSNDPITNGGLRERGDGQPDAFELRIGEYWFAYVGIAVLVLAFVFMLSLPWSGIHPVLPSLLGLSICGAMAGSAHYSKVSYKFISLNLWGAAFVLSFFSVLRLFHFGEFTLFDPGYLENVVLTVFCIGLVATAFLKKSNYLFCIGISLLLAAGIVINQPIWTLSLNALAAGALVYFTSDLKKSVAFSSGSIMIYAAHLIWMIGNPIMTGQFESLANPLWDQTFILIYASILSVRIILPLPKKRKNEYVIANALANGTPAFLLFNASFLLHSGTNPLSLKIIFFLVFFGLALVFWNRLKINFSMVLFTLLAHGTISIGFTQSIASPDLYVILIWQSLLMLANALWFKSKFITVSNFLLYIVLFIAYTAASGFAGIISVSFGFVALFSARLLRAYEARLGSSFDILINFYLAIAFFSLPFALWKALPTEWIAFSWLGITVLYYFMSAVLKSPRYRWMGHFTLFATILTVVLMATMGMEAIYRIFTFMALGGVLITVSVVYTRIRKRSKNEIS
ncbi:MAG: hypothetical protein HQ508_01125, partial [Candidatus Marinimicrobia bacterium]|nr:hypothetical protein [Candidatus Neomarinimicrobiota bacterium]